MAARPPVGLPRLSRRSRILLIIGALLLAGLVSGSRLLAAYVDWLWFGEVGFRSVFTTRLVTSFMLLVAVGVVVGGLVALNMWIAYRSRPVFVPVSGPDDPVSRYRSAVLQRLRLFGIGLPVLIGLVAGASAYGDWQVVQLFLHSTSFGVQDPEFHRDISFYAFRLPFYTWLLGWAFIAVVVAFFATMVAHYLFGGIRLAGRGGQLSGPARVQLAVIIGVFVLLKAVAYFFDRYQLLSSNRNQRFTGATYTDLNAVLPAKLILLCIAVFCAIAFFVGAFLRNLQLPAIAVVLLVLSSLLVGAAWPGVLQQFSVKPNEKQKEAIPISRSIAATRQAYGLTSDKVKYVDYQGKSDVSLAEVKADQATIPNARLLDPNVLAKTFTQLQQNRNFYGFPPKLGIDRYTVNGVTSDYLVAAREINSENLAPDQKDWINRHLVYTHGNGFVAAPANQVNSTLNSASGDSGYPVFKVSDVSTQGDIPVSQPRIYYGELASDYAIVGGSGGAPAEYDTPTTGFTYDGSGGVPIGNWADRLAFAAYYGERNILFSNAIGSNSRIMYNRDPRDRVSKAAPWLTIDGDPYPAVVGSKIVWIVDGYTTLQNYPYAQQTALAQATNDTLTGVRRQPNTSISYIRNSVKATVDAYTGKVTLYAVDGTDPVLKAWMGVFPGVVKPASDISPELRSHFRYPEDMFKVQRELLAKYHLDDPGEFWSASFWEVPTDPTFEPSAGQQTAQQPPYYVLAADPTTGKPAFQLTSALVALKRDFLAAYVAASCDPQSYGNITVLRLPGETQTKGPQQVQNAFRSTPQISTELNILSGPQQQTKVVYGNLLTLPVAGGLLYVEPVYIERSGQTAFPQLAKVLISYAGRIGYASTLADALNQVFGNGAGDTTVKPGPDTQTTPSPPTSSTAPSTQPSGPGTVNPDLTKAAEDIHNALDRIKKAQQSANFADLGQAYKDLDDATSRFLAAQRQTGSPSSGSPPSSSPPPSSALPSPTPTR